MGEEERKSSKSSDATLDWAKFTWEAFKGVIAGAAAVFAFFANQQSAKNSDALDTLKAQAEARAQQSALDIKVFELLEKTLSLEGASARGHGIAAAAIINALTLPPLRDGFLNALYAASKDEALLKQLDEAKEFDAQGGSDAARTEPAAQGTSSRVDESRMPDLWNAVAPRLEAAGQAGALKGYHIDIFYCEAQVSKSVTDGRQKKAQAAADQIKKSTGGDVDARVRMLPMLVQARPEYRSVADEIRYDQELREEDAAKALAKMINIRPENLRRASASRTPSYLSVFYCAG
jgi:hypothetical protein